MIVKSPLPRLAAFARGAVRAVRGRAHRSLALWRRSLQLRIVATTLIISATVVALLGVIVLHQVRDGLLQTKVKNALNEQSGGLASAKNQLDARGTTDVGQLLYQVTQSLASNRGGQAGLYEVLIFSSPGPGDPLSPSAAQTRQILTTSVPTALRTAVARTPNQYFAYTTLRYADGSHTPGLAVGGAIASNDGTYQLYYLFPLSQEQQTMSLVSQTLLLTGLALVLLLAGIAWLVTRQVVTPVRMAARTAERLAAGRLEERMAVKGEDDLARLAKSFNKMADGLQRHIRRLEELSRAQRRFVSDVSHELRTPITTVRMGADVLYEAREGFNPAVARSAELLQMQLDRFEALLSDLLEISRHDAGAIALEADLVDVRLLVRRVAEAVEPLAVRRGSPLVLHLPDEAIMCEADGRRVERILRNLLDNAIEHGDGEPVEVFVAQDADAIAVAVRDHGVGLRPGEAALVFNRFWRADPARARTTGGTGLGLAIAIEDARLHGGTLQAWGRRGVGSQFLLTLPRRALAELQGSPLSLDPTRDDVASSEAVTVTVLGRAFDAALEALPDEVPGDLRRRGGRGGPGRGSWRGGRCRSWVGGQPWLTGAHGVWSCPSWFSPGCWRAARACPTPARCTRARRSRWRTTTRPTSACSRPGR